jgi:hypothetical protein
VVGDGLRRGSGESAEFPTDGKEVVAMFVHLRPDEEEQMADPHHVVGEFLLSFACGCNARLRK